MAKVNDAVVAKSTTPPQSTMHWIPDGPAARTLVITKPTIANSRDFEMTHVPSNMLDVVGFGLELVYRANTVALNISNDPNMIIFQLQKSRFDELPPFYTEIRNSLPGAFIIDAVTPQARQLLWGKAKTQLLLSRPINDHLLVIDDPCEVVMFTMMMGEYLVDPRSWHR